MTHDEIISIYKEVSNKICNGTEWCWVGAGEPLQLFAHLVAAKEREACAKVCEFRIMGDNSREDLEARKCATAIRTRGEQA